MTVSEASEQTQIGFLTNGMPEAYRQQLATQPFLTCEDWLRAAVALESVKQYRTRNYKQHDLFHGTPEQNNRRKREDKRKKFGNIDYSQPPRTPCPRCLLDYGIRDLHWKRNCPRPDIRPGSNANQNPTTAPNSQSAVTTAVIANFVYYDVWINGVHFRPFLDTGASMSMMSTAAAKRVGLKPDPRQAITIQHINGTAKTRGRVIVKLRIGSQTKNIPFQVIDNFVHEILLGVDTAANFGLKVDFSRRQASYTAVEPVILSARNLFGSDRILFV